MIGEDVHKNYIDSNQSFSSNDSNISWKDEKKKNLYSNGESIGRRKERIINKNV